MPSLSAVEDDVFKASLSATLMRNAEVTQPWSTIGFDIWIEQEDGGSFGQVLSPFTPSIYLIFGKIYY